VHHVGILYGQFMMHGQRNIKYYSLFMHNKPNKLDVGISVSVCSLPNYPS